MSRWSRADPPQLPAADTGSRGTAPGGNLRSAPGLRLLERVSALIGESVNLQETLESVVEVVSDRMRTEACSFYLLDEDGATLTLWATIGLDRATVGRVKMRID